MKKVFIAFGIAAACYACGGGTTEGDSKPVSNNETNVNSQIGGASAAAPAPAAVAADTAAAAPAAAPVAKADAGNGKALIEGSDCRTCHKDDVKHIGPAYKEVAKKYEANDKNVKMLAEKILKGGQGVWGEIPMAGHPNLSEADAEAMVRYILSMK